MARILVTGGCGFVGANLVPMLADAGHTVTIFDDFSRGSRDYLDDPGRYRLIEGDIRDAHAIGAAVSGQDCIVHLAAFGSVVESVAAPAENFSINVDGTFRVLEAAREAGVARVLFSSTGGALIGNATPPVNEQSVPRPISPYGASKLAGEGYCCAFANAYPMSVTALRFANVIGPISAHKKGASTAFIRAITSGQPLRIFGDGSATRDFLYVEDLCRGILAALEAGAPGFRVYHLASGREVSVLELADLIRKAAGAPEHPIEFAAGRAGEVERNFADYALAASELGFRPTVTMEEAVRRTWEWFQQNDATS